MKQPLTRRGLLRGAAYTAGAIAVAGAASAAEGSHPEVDRKAAAALADLYRKSHDARELGERARGILVMPEITKAGFLLGGAYGEGTLMINGQAVENYSVAAGSLGFQAGVQQTAQVIFFMTTAALEKFRRSEGWTMGANAEITVIDDGLKAGLDNSEAQSSVIAITFGREGFMAGLSVEGGKYNRL